MNNSSEKTPVNPLLRNGDILGHYIIERCLGIGGMGEVYLAHHARMNSLFAIKLVKPGVLQSDPIFSERFLREARLMSRFQHPGTIAVFDANMDRKSGFLYMVMEYVDGQTLEEILKDGPVTELQALEIVFAVAETLAAAVPLGLVHRDIKPANIMITRTGVVKLADFGIAKASDHELSVTLTMDNLMVGTAAYAAPEQLQDAHRVDARADIYSLGATLYEMLTGCLPFSGGNLFDTMTHVLSDPIPDPRKKNPRITAETAALLNTMLAKSPDDRPQNAQALQDLIAPHLASLKISTPELQALIRDRADQALERQCSSMTTQEVRLRRKIFLRTGTAAAGLIVLCVVLLCIAVVLNGRNRIMKEKIRCAEEQVLKLKRTFSGAAGTASADDDPFAAYTASGSVRKHGTKESKPAETPQDNEDLSRKAEAQHFVVRETPEEQAEKERTVAISDMEKLELVWCPPGEFLMGSPLSEKSRRSDEFQHKVIITKGFWIGRHEVTQPQYIALMNQNPTSEMHIGLRHPVEVTWFEAVEFCRNLNERELLAGRLPEGYVYALPTEALWEYACRAGAPGAFCGVAGGLDKCAVWKQFPFAKTGTKLPNAWGIYDMLGNAGEWVMDRYSAYPHKTEKDPVPRKDGRNYVARGGAVGLPESEFRAAARRALPPDTRRNIGFRIALIPENLVRYDFK